MSEIIFATQSNKAQIQYQLTKRQLRKIANGVYTTSLHEDLNAVIRRNAIALISYFFPKCYLSHKTAYTHTADEKGKVFLSGPYVRQKPLGPITYFVATASAKPDLRIMSMDGLSYQYSSLPQALLENFTIPRDDPDRVFPRPKAVEIIVEHRGTLNFEAMEAIADANRMRSAFERIKSLVRDYDAKKFVKYDRIRVGTFRRVAATMSAMSSGALQPLPEQMSTEKYHKLAFTLSYFSNYIEGSELKWQEAVEERPTPDREKDWLDIHKLTDCYKSQELLRALSSWNVDRVIAALLAAHKHYFDHRSSADRNKKAGEWKKQVNFVGSHEFVAPELVEATLREGYKISFSIPDKALGALHAGFVTTEVHPFFDGNGRASRLLQDVMLMSIGRSPCLITKKGRRSYLASLNRLTNGYSPYEYIKRCEEASELVAKKLPLDKSIDEIRQFFSNRKDFDEEEPQIDPQKNSNDFIQSYLNDPLQNYLGRDF
jgi:hypothetical protein